MPPYGGQLTYGVEVQREVCVCMGRRALVTVAVVLCGCPSGTKLSPITVSSVTDPVAVSSVASPVAVSGVTQPVTVSAIQAPVTVSAIGGAVSVASVAEPVAISSIAQPVAVSTVGRIDSPVTVTGGVQIPRPENDPDRIETGGFLAPSVSSVACGSVRCGVVGTGPFILTDVVLTCSSLTYDTVTFFAQKDPPDASAPLSGRWHVDFRCSGLPTLVATGLRLAAKSGEKIYAYGPNYPSVGWSGFHP